jgi:hypothetical protein
MTSKIKRRTTMPAPLVVGVERADKDQAEPHFQTDRLALLGLGGRLEEVGHVLRRVARLVHRPLRIGTIYYDPHFTGPDIVEDDYYRFRHQPRD